MSVPAPNPSPLPSPIVQASEQVTQSLLLCHYCETRFEKKRTWNCTGVNFDCVGKTTCYNCNMCCIVFGRPVCSSCSNTLLSRDSTIKYRGTERKDIHGNPIFVFEPVNQVQTVVTLPSKDLSSSGSHEVVAVNGPASRSSAKPTDRPIVASSESSQESDAQTPAPLPSVERLFAKFKHYFNAQHNPVFPYRSASGRTPEIFELYVYVLNYALIGATDPRIELMESELIDAIFRDSLVQAVSGFIANLEEFSKTTNDEISIPCFLTYDTLETLQWSAQHDPSLLQRLQANLPDLFIGDQFYWFSETFRRLKSTRPDDFSIHWEKIKSYEIPVAPTSPAYSPASPSYYPESPEQVYRWEKPSSPPWAPASPPREPTSPSRCPVHSTIPPAPRPPSPSWAPASPPRSESSSESCSCKGGPFPKPAPPVKKFRHALNNSVGNNPPPSPPRSRALLKNKKAAGQPNGDPAKVVEIKRKAQKRVTRSQSAKRLRFQE